MNEEEKKDISDPRINYRTDWAEKHGERKEAANEKSNQAQGEKVERVRDAESGKVKTVKEHLLEGKEREGKTFTDRVGKKEPVHSKKGISEPHLKSTTALTDPETAKQNLKDASKAKNFGKETPPSRGGGFRGGGSPMMREPDEILKEKHKNTNPEDILSKKAKMPVLNSLQQKQEQQQQQAKYQPNIAQSFKPLAPKNILDELPKNLVNSEKAIATLKAVNAKQMNPEKTTKAPEGKEKKIQIAENKVKSQPPKGIKR